MKRILSVLLVAVLALSMSSCLKYTSNILEVTQPRVTEPLMTSFTPSKDQYADVPPTVPQYIDPSDIVTEAPLTELPSAEPSTEAPVTEAPVTEAPSSEAVTAEPSTEAEKDITQYSKTELIAYLTDAVNKTKAYTDPLTVKHVENFNITVDEITGGSLVKNVANPIIEKVVAPTDETLQFNGGTAVNSEGETVPIILPKSGNFYLPEEGCASISAAKNGSFVTITATLAAETGTLTAKPAYNSQACGFLDVGSLDISAISFSEFNVNYSGTKLVITVNEQGYVTSADYTIPISFNCVGKAVGITAKLSCSGYENEVWTLNW